MKFYDSIFLGFLCMVKKFMPKEENPEAYAAGFISGAVCFLYFAVTVLMLNRGAKALETAGVFFVIYAAHHYFYIGNEKYKLLEKETPCSDQLIYRGLLFFVSALFLLMYAAMKLG